MDEDPESLDILFGNGSDEIIALLISSLIGSGRACVLLIRVL